MKTHFKDEETYMQSINYPEHKAMHKKIIKDMSILLNDCNSTNDLKEKLYEIVSAWLLEHIVKHDMMIYHYLESLKNPNTNTQQEVKNKDVFYYTCACEKVTHKLDYGTHVKIQ
ncbi:hemerythrin family protein, partial [Campylobacter coli]|nr:hemerythrin family protein [Campylobacter coli]